MIFGNEISMYFNVWITKFHDVNTVKTLKIKCIMEGKNNNNLSEIHSTCLFIIKNSWIIFSTGHLCIGGLRK